MRRTLGLCSTPVPLAKERQVGHREVRRIDVARTQNDQRDLRHDARIPPHTFDAVEPSVEDVGPGRSSEFAEHSTVTGQHSAESA